LPLEEKEKGESRDIMKREESVIALVLYENQGAAERANTKSE
jgi:hypothetical protein